MLFYTKLWTFKMYQPLLCGLVTDLLCTWTEHLVYLPLSLWLTKDFFFFFFLDRWLTKDIFLWVLSKIYRHNNQYNTKLWTFKMYQPLLCGLVTDLLCTRTEHLVYLPLSLWLTKDFFFSLTGDLLKTYSFGC